MPVGSLDLNRPMGSFKRLSIRLPPWKAGVGRAARGPVSPRKPGLVVYLPASRFLGRCPRVRFDVRLWAVARCSLRAPCGPWGVRGSCD